MKISCLVAAFLCVATIAATVRAGGHVHLQPPPTHICLNGGCPVTAFGADPTGAIDSEPGFSRALAAATTNFSNVVTVPPGKFRINFPIWIKPNPATGMASLRGAGGISQSSRILGGWGNFPMLYIAPADQFSTLNEDFGAGVLWTSPLAGSVGRSMAANRDWWMDLKPVLPGNFSTMTDIPLSGLSQLDVQFWANIADTTNGNNNQLIGSSGSDGNESYVAYGPVSAFYDVTNSGALDCIAIVFNIGGTAYGPGCVGSFTSNRTHFFEGSYDGAHIRIFIDGTQVGSSVAATGAIRDYPYVNLTLDSGEPWPTRSAGNGFKGQLFGFALSKIARNTSNYTAPTSAPAAPCDSNNLITIDGTTVNSDQGISSSSGPFVQPECLNGSSSTSNVWIPMRNGGVTTAMIASISGLSLTEGVQYGILANQVLRSNFSDIYVHAPYVGIQEENNSYFNTWKDIESDGYNSGFNFLWPAQVCIGCQTTSQHYEWIDFGGINLLQAFFTPPKSALACIITSGSVNPFAFEHLDNAQCDNENGSTGPSLVASGRVEVDGSLFVGSSPILAATNTSIRLQGSYVDSGAQAVVAAAYGASNLSSTTVEFDQTILTNGGLTRNTQPLVDKTSAHYQVTTSDVGAITGTTAGMATWSFPIFTDNSKTLIVKLNSYENTTATAQRFMLPWGLSSLGIVSADTGNCTGITIGTGSNTGCTAVSTPHPCCNGRRAGTCSSLQFATLPSSMGRAQTGVCRAVGD